MTVVAHRQDTAVRYRIYGHILSCNARLHELELTLPPDSTENTDLRVQFLSSDESIPLPSSWYHTVSLADGTPWLRYAEISSGYLLHFPHLADFVFDTSNNSILCLPQAKPPHTPCTICCWIRSFPLCSTTKGKKSCMGLRSSHPMAPVHSSVQPAQENLPWRQAFCLRDIPC